MMSPNHAKNDRDYHTLTGRGLPKMGGTQNLLGWFISWKNPKYPNLKWMMNRGTGIDGNQHWMSEDELLLRPGWWPGWSWWF